MDDGNVTLAKGLARSPQERSLLVGAVPAFDVLKRALQERLDGLRGLSESDRDFSEPNWPEKQAYVLGQLNMLKTVMKLLPKDKEST